MNQSDYELDSSLIGAMPIVNHFLARLGLDDALDRAVPRADARLRMAPAKALGVVVRNLAIRHEPIYALGEWARGYEPALLGLDPDEVRTLNDDRVGRTLTRLFDADRASLVTGVVLDMVRNFVIDCTQLHNDSTTVTFSGLDYPGGGGTRGDTVVAKPAHGHNKDFRPDQLQLLWILTVVADGAVPIAYRVESGNTADDVTHVPTWEELRQLVGATGFLYVADCKLASAAAMGHIDRAGGRFVTILPQNRKEVSWFTQWVKTHVPDWAPADWTDRAERDDQQWHTFEAPLPSEGGYRVIWVHSSAKEVRDGATRARRLGAGHDALEQLCAKLAGPRCRLKSIASVERAVAKALEGAQATRYFATHVAQRTDDDFRQEERGRPGSGTRYRKTTTSRFELSFAVRAEVVADDAKCDGTFPLITNDRTMTPAAVLGAYKYQPNLERRHAQLKGHQLVAPVYLKDPVRIEGLLCCHFFALIVQALIEREIRAAMKAANTRSIPLYPELRDRPSPSASRVLEIFTGVSRHILRDRDGRVIQVFEPELDKLQLQVLELLAIPVTDFTQAAGSSS
jgi:transposase